MSSTWKNQLYFGDNLDEDTAGFEEAVKIASQAGAVILVQGDSSWLMSY